jgi:hypothetical protein
MTYDRPEMLTKAVDNLGRFGVVPTIKDDGSTYETNLPQYFRHKHRGKDMFWLTWDEMLKDCYMGGELFVFMPDDFQDLEFNRILKLHEKYKDSPYVYNILNDGREGLFTGVVPYQVDEDTIMCGFTDCGFFCNYQALERLGFGMERTDVKEDSSGVGRNLSMRFLAGRVLMYKPVKSLAYHGTHESKMHPEERKRNPLKSL